MPNKEDIIKTLKEKGHRCTNQREAILDVLINNKSHFISAEDIYIKTKKIYPKTNFSTVYRTLELLDRLEIIHSTTTDGKKTIYEIICKDSHHHHIICKNCGKTKVVDFCPYTNIKENLAKEGFKLTDHKFELYGYCENCNDDD
ncbi:transcriptional repressor [Clostridium sp. D2Q-14]|uniref:Fur family transcriptional regulator n=1 Tax=Anaeromonas gelatinilytica TaxID=2683194 RepID=UPI00193B809C|nr:Fur family transcriptional regulator [Anaeromonas gelatinilytica]MBS4536346.1 transcriptional repressor [Anaeromonas gelatinilytica]